MKKKGGFTHREGGNGYQYHYNPDTKYYFYLPNQSACILFWQNLFEVVAGHKGKIPFSRGVYPQYKDIDDAFETISGEYITTYQYHPPEVGLIPVVVYNVYRGNGCGFALFYHGNSKVSVAKMDEDTFNKMIEIFHSVKQKDDKNMIFHWRDAKLFVADEYSIKREEE